MMQYTGSDLDAIIFFGATLSAGQPILARGYTITDDKASFKSFANGDTISLKEALNDHIAIDSLTFDSMSIVLRTRAKKIAFTGEIDMKDGTKAQKDFTCTNSKSLGFYIDQVTEGLSLRKDDIADIKITRAAADSSDDDHASYEILWITPSWAVDINQSSGLQSLTCQNSLPQNNSIVVPGLALGSGSLKFRDIGNNILGMVENYSTVGVASLAGMTVNDIMADSDGNLVITKFYDSPSFSLDSDGNLVSDVDLGNDLNIDDGNLMVDYSTAVNSPMTKSGKPCFIFLGNNLIYQMVSKSWSYDTTNSRVTFKLVDILSLLNDSNYQLSNEISNTTSIMDNINAGINLILPSTVGVLSPFATSIDLASTQNDAIKLNLDGGHTFKVTASKTVRNYIDNVCNGIGIIFALEPYGELDRFGNYRGDFHGGEFDEYNLVQYTSMFLARGINETPFKPLALSAKDGGVGFYSYTVTKETQNIYSLANGDLTSAVTRNVIKDNYISLVGWTEYTPTLDSDTIAPTAQNNIGTTGYPFTMDSSQYFFTATDGTQSTWTDSLGTTSLAEHWAQAYIDNYVIGRDEVSFTALLRDTLTPSSQSAINTMGVGELFKLAIDEPAIKSDFNYEIIDSTLEYDGQLTFDITGLQI